VPPPVGQAAPNAQIKNRLEQLDDFEEGSVQEMQGLTFQDWMKKSACLSLYICHVPGLMSNLMTFVRLGTMSSVSRR
jgi:hypothetical protein